MIQIYIFWKNFEHKSEMYRRAYGFDARSMPRRVSKMIIHQPIKMVIFKSCKSTSGSH